MVLFAPLPTSPFGINPEIRSLRRPNPPFFSHWLRSLSHNLTAQQMPSSLGGLVRPSPASISASVPRRTEGNKLPSPPPPPCHSSGRVVQQARCWKKKRREWKRSSTVSSQPISGGGERFPPLPRPIPSPSLQRPSFLLLATFSPPFAPQTSC